jgi:hypothetical protein
LEAYKVFSFFHISLADEAFEALRIYREKVDPQSCYFIHLDPLFIAYICWFPSKNSSQILLYQHIDHIYLPKSEVVTIKFILFSQELAYFYLTKGVN